MATNLSNVVIRVTDNASYEGLHTQLLKEANARALALRIITGKILTYSISNKNLYIEPLSNAETGGESFDCTVSIDVRQKLRDWASQENRKLSQHCAFILAKTLEDKLLSEVFAPK